MLTKYRAVFLFIAVSCLVPCMYADSITITGKLSSDQTAVGSGDPVITDPTTINIGDPFTITLTYDPTSFTHSSNTYTLTDATLSLGFDGYSFPYTTGAGNYMAFSTPGAFGPGTVSFLFCSSLPGCSTSDFLTLYLVGSITNLSTLASQAGGLAGDPGASPSEFEFLRNFDADGSQTDLQGVITGVRGSTAVPEPSSLILSAGALVGVLFGRRFSKTH